MPLVKRKFKRRPGAARHAFASSACLLGLALALASAGVAAQDAPQTVNPPLQTQPTGVTPLPTTPPPTGLQAKLPTPQRTLPRPDKPMLASPNLTELFGRAPTGPISIDQAVAIALGNSRDLAAATEVLLRAQGNSAEARAAFNPTLGANFTYTRLDASQSATFNNVTIPLVIADQPQLGATATLPIDISGLLETASDQAHFQEVAYRLDVNRARNQVVSDTKNAFYNVLRAQALVTVAQETLRDDLDRLSDAQKKLAAGTVAPFDVLRAQTDVANAQQQLITARSNVSLTIANLNSVIGINIDAPVQVTDKGAVENPPGIAPPAVAPGSPDAVPTPAPSKPAPPAPAAPPGGQGANTTSTAITLNLGPEYSAVVQEALRDRPEILEADAQLAAARKGIRLAFRSHLPSMGVTLGITYSPLAAGLAPKELNGSLVVAITAPIFDGGVARARLEQARAQVASAETNRRQAVDVVNLDVRSSYLTLLQARDRVAVANQALEEAQESYRLARVRYNNGISTLVEVSDAQAALTQAENNQVNALYDYNNARASLDKAAGRYSYLTHSPGYPAPPSAQEIGYPITGGQK